MWEDTMKIMIAYDGSRNAKLALAQVVNMFRCNQPLLVLVGVVVIIRGSRV